MSKSKQQLVDEKLTIERALRHMLTEHVMLFVHPEKCTLALFWGPDAPENVIEFFTRSEWDILLVLTYAYPHYAPYEWLLQQLPSYSIDQARELLHAAASSTDRNRLLKPVHRALSSLRKKLQQLHPHLNISQVYETGYALTSPTQGKSMSSSLSSQGGSEVQMSSEHSFDEKVPVEQTLRQLLPQNITPFVTPEKRAIAVFWGPDSPHNGIALFTPSEWKVLLVLAESYPHYSPFEALMARLMAGPADYYRERWHQA